MKTKFFIFATLLLAVLTYVFYRYHDAQPPDAAQIERCEALADAMPESTPEEINRSLHTLHECLED